MAKRKNKRAAKKSTPRPRKKATKRALSTAQKQSLLKPPPDYDETVRALEREIARISDEKQKVQIVRKVIRELVESCPPQPVPPGIGAAVDWLRVNPNRARR